MRRLRFGRLTGFMLAAVIAGAASGADILTRYKGKSIAAWVAAVRKPSGEFDARAIRVVAELGPDARAAVPVLIQALDDKDCDWEALHALAAIGPDARAAVPKLIALLRKSERGYPAYCLPLSSIGKPAVPALKELMKDKNIGHRAAEAIGDMGEAGMEILIAALRDKDAAVRANAAYAMSEMEPGPTEALVPLARALSDEDEAVRIAAARAFYALGTEAKDAVPELAKAVKHKSAAVRGHAIAILHRIGPGAAAAVPALISALDDKDDGVQLAAIHALGSIGTSARDAAGPLARFLKKETARNLRAAAIMTIGRVAVDSSAVIELLKDDDSTIRWSAAWGLIQSSPLLAAPVFREALRDPERRYDATEALKLIGKDAVSQLIDAMRDTDKEVRTIAVEQLGEIGPPARAAVLGLVGALKDKEPAIRFGAADALSKIDPGNKAALGMLVAALKSEDLPYNRYKVATILGRFGSLARTQIVEVLRSANPGVRAAAVFALGEAEPGTRETIRLLIAALADKDDEVRGCAVVVLGPFAAMDPEAAVGPLTAVLNDDNCAVRAGAARALGRIGAPAKSAVPALIAALKEPAGDGPRWKRDRGEFYTGSVDPVSQVRSNAAYALGRIGAEAKGATRALAAALKDEHYDVGYAAAWALARVAPDPNLCVRQLIAALERDTYDHTKACAALALGELGADARDAVAGLADALRYGSRDLKGCAAWALGRIGPEATAAAPAIARFLTTPEPIPGRIEYPRQTGYGGHGGEPAGPKMPELRPLIRNDDRDARIEAAAALRQIRREP